MPAKEINIRYFKVDPKEIVYIKAVLESYEGMVVVRTVEVGRPVIELLIAHDFRGPVQKVLEDLSKEVSLVEVKKPLPKPPEPKP